MAAGSSVIPMHMMRISLHHRNVDVHQPDFGRLWAKLRILNRMEEQDLDGSNSAKVLFCGHGEKHRKIGLFPCFPVGKLPFYRSAGWPDYGLPRPEEDRNFFLKHDGWGCPGTSKESEEGGESANHQSVYAKQMVNLMQMAMMYTPASALLIF